MYILNKAILTLKKIKLINNIKFSIIIFNLNENFFIIYLVFYYIFALNNDFF